MLALVWTIAIVGVALKSIFFTSTPEALGVGLYIGMGWMGLVSGAALVRRHGVRFLVPMILGGVVYTAGALADLLGFPVLIPGVLGPHELFHLAVLGGLGLHWYFVRSLAEGGPGVAGRIKVLIEKRAAA
jgi:channel protein (hemolysin III family)